MTDKPVPSAEERAAAFEFTWGEGWGAIRKRFAAELTDHAEAAVKEANAVSHDLWATCRDVVLDGLDGLDNDQTNTVLYVLDDYEPECGASLESIRAEAAKDAREECASLPWDSQRFSGTSGYTRGHQRGWDDYAAAIRALDVEGK